MNRSLAVLRVVALCAVFVVVMAICGKRLSWLRYQASEEIPSHFNGAPLEWSEQRWVNLLRAALCHGAHGRHCRGFRGSGQESVEESCDWQ